MNAVLRPKELKSYFTRQQNERKLLKYHLTPSSQIGDTAGSLKCVLSEEDKTKDEQFIVLQEKKKAVGNHCLLVPDTSSTGLLGGCAPLARGPRAADLSVLVLKVSSL